MENIKNHKAGIAFADDVTGVVTNEKDAKRFIEITERWAKKYNMLLNKDKCCI